VRDQRDRELVDPGVPGEAALRELRQLAVVATGETLADLADVLLDDVEVVEQPVAGGSDVDVLVGRGGEPRVGVIEDQPGAVESGEQRRTAAAAVVAAAEPLAGGDLPCPIDQVFDAEELAADRTREQLLAGFAASLKEAGQTPEWWCGRNGEPLVLWTARAANTRKGNDDDCPSCLVSLYFATTSIALAGLEGGPVPDVPYKVDKPWGHELVWARTDRYVGKILHVKAGHILSLQYHNRKDETMHLLAGELILRTQPDSDLVERRMRAGESVHIPPKLIHQIEAVVDSDVLEASTADLDDLVRLEDRYGRL
jgi:mannose-6-phosphate isomerase-like protein (cupin superfamily)